jgi:hypothetical protein
MALTATNGFFGRELVVQQNEPITQLQGRASTGRCFKGHVDC